MMLDVDTGCLLFYSCESRTTFRPLDWRVRIQPIESINLCVDVMEALKADAIFSFRTAVGIAPGDTMTITISARVKEAPTSAHSAISGT